MAAQEAVQQTIQTWQPHYKQELTDRDAEEIQANWSAYIDLISGWVAAAHEWDEA